MAAGALSDDTAPLGGPSVKTAPCKNCPTVASQNGPRDCKFRLAHILRSIIRLRRYAKHTVRCDLLLPMFRGLCV